MSLSSKEVVNSVLNLSEKERAEIAHYLILSLDSCPVSDETAWEKEIKRRVDEIKSGKAKGRPAADVLAEIETKYS